MRCGKFGHWANDCNSDCDKTPKDSDDSGKRVTFNLISCALVTPKVDNNSEWIVDCAATDHVCYDKNMFSSLKQCNGEITMGKGTAEVKGHGTVKLKVDNECGGNDININDVLYVPDFCFNLLSTTKLSQKGIKVVLDRDKGTAYLNDVHVFSAPLIDDLYRLKVTSNVNLSTANIISANDEEAQVKDGIALLNAATWHQRLAHLNIESVSKIDVLGCKRKMVECDPCILGKQTKKGFPKKSDRKSEKPLELIHSDLVGKLPMSMSKAQYFITFIDDYSRHLSVRFLKRKNEAFAAFKEYLCEVELLHGLRIKSFQTDGGGEYISNEFEEYLASKGIAHRKTVAYCPPQNGIAERINRTILNSVRCLLVESGLPNEFWAEAANTVVTARNLCPSRAIDFKIPNELWLGRKLSIKDYAFLKVFGCQAWMHLPGRNKLEPRATECVFLGYEKNVKGYRLWLRNEKKVKIAHNVSFRENVFPYKSDEKQVKAKNVIFLEGIPDDDPIIVGNDQVVPVHDNKKASDTDVKIDLQEVHVVGTNDDSDEDDDFFLGFEVKNVDKKAVSLEIDSLNDHASTSNNLNASDADDSSIVLPDSSTNNARPNRSRKPPSYLSEYQTDLPKSLVNEHIAMVLFESSYGIEPLTYEQAINDKNRNKWLEAMNVEMNALKKNSVWELVERPKGKNIVKSKWVFKIKTDSSGELDKFRARVVAKGFSQKYGIDYEETFAPVVRHSTLRLLFAIAVNEDMDIEHVDISTAFLNGHLSEEIFMEQPPGFEIGNKVCKLQKCIYGLKQASRSWNQRLHTELIKLEFKQNIKDPCVYFKRDIDGNLIIIAVYVDDFYVFSKSKCEKEKLYTALEENFDVKFLGELKNCLGMRVCRNRAEGTLTIDQTNYVKKLLIKFGMENCNIAATPMEVNLKLDKAGKCNVNLPYRELIGGLMYLSVSTRPDISFTCSKLGQFLNCYDKEHFLAGKRVLRYLAGTAQNKLLFKKGEANLELFADADWGSCTVDRKSFSGFIVKFGNSTVNWESKKQKVVALSSTEAEYYSVAEAGKEVIYLKQLLKDLNVGLVRDCVTIYNDNQSSHKVIEGTKEHRRVKHFDVRYHFIKDLVCDKVCKIEYRNTNDMVADILTKSLTHVKHDKHVKSLGLVS